MCRSQCWVFQSVLSQDELKFYTVMIENIEQEIE